MNTSIKSIFGNNNIRRQYINFLLNPDESCPPLPPILYRQIAAGENDYDTIFINFKSRHKAITREIIREFTQQYNIYRQLSIPR